MDTPLPQVHLPPLSTLTKVNIHLCSNDVSGRLADLLSSIHSAPALSSVTFTFPARHAACAFSSSGRWIGVDKRLGRLASERGKAEGGLLVMLTPWPEGNSSWGVLSRV
jgi:hypothetical protein